MNRKIPRVRFPTRCVSDVRPVARKRCSFLAQLRGAGMPEPEIHLDGSDRIDLLWREHKLVVQLDDVL
jgi:hypothetical protein